jgi:hypothetical protein
MFQSGNTLLLPLNHHILKADVRIHFIRSIGQFYQNPIMKNPIMKIQYSNLTYSSNFNSKNEY